MLCVREIDLNQYMILRNQCSTKTFSTVLTCRHFIHVMLVEKESKSLILQILLDQGTSRFFLFFIILEIKIDPHVINESWYTFGAFSFVPLSEFVGRPSWTKSGP